MMDENDPFQLLTTQELLSLPPITWLMDNMIPEEGVVGLYGAPGSGKSFVALDWAMCISEGRPWLGLHPTQQSPVIYVAAEGGRGIQQRVRAWMGHHGYRDLPAIYFLLNPLYVREEGAVESFLDTLEEADIWPGLIVLDTLSRSFGGGEENSSADMGLFMERIIHLAKGRRMALLVVHHMNATGSRERGHTSFRGNLDTLFKCEAAKSETGQVLRVDVKNDKQKDGIEQPTISMSPVEDVKLSLVFEPCATPVKKQKGVGAPKVMDKSAMLAVLESHGEGLTFTEWSLAARVPKRTFARRLIQLTRDSEIYKDELKYYAMPTNEDLAAIGDEDDD